MVRNNAHGVYFIFKSIELGSTFRVSVPKYPANPNYRIIANQRSRFTHYYFTFAMKYSTPSSCAWARSSRPRPPTNSTATASLNISSIVSASASARTTTRFSRLTTRLPCRPPLKLSPEIIRKRLDYWSFILGPKFSAKERRHFKLSRIYAISEVEYCFNFVFKRNFPIHKLVERSCELGLWRSTAHRSPRSSARPYSATTG
jgi:hypothetical protein